MTDITFIVPNAHKAIMVKNHYQTLGVAILAKGCEKNGYKANIIDAYLEDLDYAEVSSRVNQSKPSKVLGFYVPDNRTLYFASKVINRLKGVDYLVIMGGPYATFNAKDILARITGVDLIIRGEADGIVPALLDKLSEESDWKSIPSISYMHNGKVVENSIRIHDKNIDNVCIPDREATIDFISDPKYGLTISTSRGCYAPCNYCVIQSFWGLAGGGKWRGLGYKRICDEIELLINKYEINYITFVDDNFFGPGAQGVKRISDLCDEIGSRGLNIEFTIYCRADNVANNKSLFEKLKRVGLKKVFIGMEAGSQQTLDAFDKVIKKEANEECLKILEALNIYAFLGVLFFHPWANFSETKENIIFWSKLLKRYNAVNTTVVGSVDVFKGTPIYDQLMQEGRLIGDTFSGYSYRYLDVKVQLVFELWESFKMKIYFPSYISAIKENGGRNGDDVNAFYCRLQFLVLSEILKLVEVEVLGDIQMLTSILAKKFNDLTGGVTNYDSNQSTKELEDCMRIACL